MGKTKKKWKALQRVKNDAIYLAARFMFFFARKVPLKIGLRIGAFIGGAAWRLLDYERNCSMIHLGVAFPELSDEQRAAYGKESFRNLGRSFFEVFHFEELFASIGGPDPYIFVEGVENMESQVASGTGGIAFTGHIGNWELMVATISYLGFPCHEVVRQLYDPRLDEILNDHRRKYNYIPLTRGGEQLIEDIQNIFASNKLLGGCLANPAAQSKERPHDKDRRQHGTEKGTRRCTDPSVDQPREPQLAGYVDRH